MQTAKSTDMGIGCLQHLTGPDADTGITFSALGSAITHLRLCFLQRTCNQHILFFLVEESLHAHRCQSYQQFERQIKQTTEEFRVHSTSYDKGSCFAMA